jgi:hypothetical protein
MKPPLERIADALESVAAVLQRSSLLLPAFKPRVDDRLPAGFEQAAGDGVSDVHVATLSARHAEMAQPSSS